MERFHTQFHFCPRCGSEYGPDSFDRAAVAWHCGNCELTFYQNSIPSGTVVIPKLGDPRRVVLLTRNTEPGMGLLALPGGFLDYGEAPDVGARREAREEVGLDVTIDRFLDFALVDYTYLGTKLWTLELAFLTRPVDVDFASFTGEEAQSVAYYDVGELLEAPERLAFPEQLKVLKGYLDRIANGPSVAAGSEAS